MSHSGVFVGLENCIFGMVFFSSEEKKKYKALQKEVNKMAKLMAMDDEDEDEEAEEKPKETEEDEAEDDETEDSDNSDDSEDDESESESEDEVGSRDRHYVHADVTIVQSD